MSSSYVGPTSPAFARYGGLHHIYANEKAIRGYDSGSFPDGSVIVFELFDTIEANGAIRQGNRKFIDVMEKDSKHFAQAGGWGFEEFKEGDKNSGSLSQAAVEACQKCHASMKQHDLVFSTLPK